MPPHELYGWLERLKLRRRDQDVVAAAVTLAPAIAERLSGDRRRRRPSCTSCSPDRPLEVLVLAAASADSPEVEERLRAYLERVRDARLEISGDDLRAAGVPESPAIGEALKQTLALKLDGFVSGPRRGAARPRCGCVGPTNRIRPCPSGGTRCSGTASPATTRSGTSPSPIRRPASASGSATRWSRRCPRPGRRRRAPCG